VGSILDTTGDWPVSDRGYMEKDTGQYQKQEEVSAFCGASVLLKRSMLEDIGVFDESFFMYFEDADLSWRGTKKGWKYLYEPRSIALHEHTGSSKEGSEFFNFYVNRNRLLILLKQSSFKIYLKAVIATIRERVLVPLKKIIKHQGSRKTALHDLKQGIKTLASFGIRAPSAYLKRIRVIPEKSLR
jgi:GT2 family glycosyltransferase